MVAKLGNGVYTFTEAARLTGLSTTRVREWFRRRPVSHGDYAPVDGDLAISFLDLIDVFVAGQLREHGVSMPTVRKVYSRMADDLQTPHPFCRKELLTDGKRVLMEQVSGNGELKLVEVLSKGGVFSEVILPVLRRIDYDKVKLLARRWRIADSIVIDPEICYGAPVVEAVGIATSILAASYNANDEKARMTASWFGVTEKDVLAAVEFEKQFAA